MQRKSDGVQERTEVAANDAVPCRASLPVEFFLDEGGDVLLDVEFVQALVFEGEFIHIAALERLTFATTQHSRLPHLPSQRGSHSFWR